MVGLGPALVWLIKSITGRQMKRPEAIASENIARRRQKFHCSNGQSQEWERNSDSDLASFRLALHVTAW
jgi:hypothetical protein